MRTKGFRERSKSGTGASCTFCSDWRLVDRGIPAFDGGEEAEAPWMGDGVAKGAFVGGNVGGANADEDIHVRTFGEEGADAGPYVVVWDGWSIG